jgi:hypothetical protein
MISFVGYLVICWIVADFISGFFHWLEDRYISDDLPILGNYIGKPNSQHHLFPSKFLENSYIGKNLITMCLALPVFVLLLPSKWSLIFLILSQANEIHSWSHQKCNIFIRTFQQTGILQSPKEHGTHHKAPFDVRYCVISNWVNPILDNLKFWSGLEFIIEKTLRIKTK